MSFFPQYYAAHVPTPFPKSNSLFKHFQGAFQAFVAHYSCGKLHIYFCFFITLNQMLFRVLTPFPKVKFKHFQYAFSSFSSTLLPWQIPYLWAIYICFFITLNQVLFRVLTPFPKVKFKTFKVHFQAFAAPHIYSTYALTLYIHTYTLTYFVFF